MDRLANARHRLRSPPVRYTLLQIPGVMVFGAVVWLLLGWGWLAPATAGWLMVVWLAKDVLLYPLYRPALAAAGARHGLAALEGVQGRARTEVAGRGLVLVQGEFWRARSVGEAIPAGTAVRVTGHEGRQLLVEPVAPEGGGDHSESQ